MFSARELNFACKIDGIKTKIIDFHPEHLNMASYRPLDKGLINTNGDKILSNLEKGQAFTGVTKNNVYAMFGVWPLWDGVMEAWLLPAKDIEDVTVTFHRVSHRFFNYCIKKKQLVRLQTWVCTENVLAIRWIEKMLFKREGRAIKYGPDSKDYFLYARTN